MQQKVLVRMGSRRAADLGVSVEKTAPAPNWVELKEATSAQQLANELSLRFETFAVSWSAERHSDFIELDCYRTGRLLRRFTYQADGGWGLTLGEPTPFENTAAIAALLERDDLLATADGPALLEAFLANEPLEVTISGPPPEFADLIAAAARANPDPDANSSGPLIGLLAKLVHLGPEAERAALVQLVEDSSLPEWFRDMARSFVASVA